MDLPKFDRYVATGILGEGSMGTVYRGFDPRLKREVAIKTVKPEILRQDPELKERFEREAKVVAVLHHPSIVQIHDFSGDYLVMELLKGEELRQLLRSGKQFSLSEIAYILHQLADALDYAHSQGVIHRDLKPANLFIDAQNRPKITDFGIAKLQDETQEGLTAAGQVLGTPSYMSPEQVQGQPLDGRSDQFSLGVVIYQMLAGKSPFAAESVTAIINKIVNVPLPPLQSFNPNAPASQEPVMQKVLAKAPEDRYPDCRAFAAAFAQAAGLSGELRLITPQEVRPLPPFMTSTGEQTLPVASGTTPTGALGKTVALGPQPAMSETAAIPAPQPEPRSWKFSAAGLALVILGLAYIYFGRDPAPAPPGSAPAAASSVSSRHPQVSPMAADIAAARASSGNGVAITPDSAANQIPLQSTDDSSALSASSAPAPVSAENSTSGSSAAALSVPQSTPASTLASDPKPATSAADTPASTPKSSAASSSTSAAKSAAKPKPTSKPASHSKKRTTKPAPKPAPKSAPKSSSSTNKSSDSKLTKPLTKTKSWIDRHLKPKKDSSD